MLKFFENINLNVYNVRDWQIFASRLKQVDKLPNTSDSDKRNFLLQNVTEDTYRLLGQLVYPHRLEIQSFKSLYDIINIYLDKHTPVSDYKEQVHRAVKEFGENLEVWMDKLKELTKPSVSSENQDNLILENRIMGPNRNPGGNMNSSQELRPIAIPVMEQEPPVAQSPQDELVVCDEEEVDNDVTNENEDSDVVEEVDDADGGKMYGMFELQQHPPPYVPMYLPPMLPAFPLDVNQNINTFGWQTTMSFFQQVPAQAPPIFKMRQPRGRLNRPAGPMPQNYNHF